MLLCEVRPDKAGVAEYACRVLDVGTSGLTGGRVPDRHWVCDWSADGTRLLTEARPNEPTPRVCLINADGTGRPEFLTPAAEFAFAPRLSPTGRQVLFKAGLPPPAGQPVRAARLYVMDVASRRPAALDDPGETTGFCWSPDGARVAYTWQPPFDGPAAAPRREARLITCDPDGRNRKTVVSRTYVVPKDRSGKPGVYFLRVLDWR